MPVGVRAGGGPADAANSCCTKTLHDSCSATPCRSVSCPGTAPRQGSRSGLRHCGCGSTRLSSMCRVLATRGACSAPSKPSSTMPGPASVCQHCCRRCRPSTAQLQGMTPGACMSPSRALSCSSWTGGGGNLMQQTTASYCCWDREGRPPRTQRPFLQHPQPCSARSCTQRDSVLTDTPVLHAATQLH
jgi:hypothetical protein